MGEAETYRPTSEPVELPFNVSRIRWLQRHGEKGSFELSDDLGNPDHKALLKFLVELAGGAVNSEGFFYWVFPDGRVIGRKPLAPAATSVTPAPDAQKDTEPLIWLSHEENLIAAHCKKWHTGACSFRGDPSCVAPTNPCAKTCPQFEE